MPSPAPHPPAKFRLVDPSHRQCATKETLVGHRTTKVCKAFRDALAHGKIEEAVHWSGELVISGTVWPIWEGLFGAAAQYYYNHRKMSVYLTDRYRRFKQVAAGKADIELRNVEMVRSIVAETAAVIAAGDRRFKATRTTMADEMFSLDHLRPHMKAPSRDIGRPYILDADPPEAAMCANEFAHALQSSRLSDAQFWAEWLLAWQRRCIKQKTSCACGARSAIGVSEKHRTTPALLLWQVLRGVVHGNNTLDITVSAWEELFMVRYSGRVNGCRAMLLLAAVYAVCNRSTLIPTLPVSNASLMPNVARGLPKIYERLAKQAGLEYREEGRAMQEVQKSEGAAPDGSALLQLLTPSRHHPIQ